MGAPDPIQLGVKGGARLGRGPVSGKARPQVISSHHKQRRAGHAAGALALFRSEPPGVECAAAPSFAARGSAGRPVPSAEPGTGTPPPLARPGQASTKGAARAAREDGARGTTAPLSLATGQAQRHLSAFTGHPPPHSAIGATRGPRTAAGPAPSGPEPCLQDRPARPGPTPRAPREAPGEASGRRREGLLRAGPGGRGTWEPGGGATGTGTGPGRRPGRQTRARSRAEKHKPAATASPPPRETRGPFCREEKKMRFTPKSLREGEREGKEKAGAEAAARGGDGKSGFSPRAAVTAGPPCPLPAAPPRRVPAPSSRLPAAPGGGKHSRPPHTN